MNYINSGAIISACGKFRYRLWRYWKDGRPVLVVIMLNPSKANAEQDDNTIRKVVRFADLWGYGGIEVVNLFAYRATDPNDLRAAGYPIGPANADHVQTVVNTYQEVLCAWGGNADCHKGRIAIKELWHAFDRTAWANNLSALKIGKKNCPYHPLYVPYATQRVPFRMEDWAS